MCFCYGNSIDRMPLPGYLNFKRLFRFIHDHESWQAVLPVDSVDNRQAPNLKTRLP